MAPAGYNFRRILFIIDDELTHAYFYLEAWGDAPIGVQGWHHKVYPASKSVLDIIQLTGKGGQEHDPVLWGQEAPPHGNS